MHIDLLRFLACPACAGDLKVEEDVGSPILEGQLTCAGCGSVYAVRNAIPRVLDRAKLHEVQERTAEAFGWEWQHFAKLHPEYEAQFLDWISPLDESFFPGKVVLDAGCGTGRHAALAARFGAARVVAFDFSDAVETAQRNCNELGTVDVIQANILEPPFRTDDGERMFDLVYSIGVLHHLPDPRGGFLSLTRFVRPGGTMFVWVYGFEGNAFVRTAIEPLRRLTTKLRPSTLRIVAWPLSVLLHGAVKLIYRPLRRTPLFRFLPVREYLVTLADFTFRQNYSIVFDQLVAPTAQYISRPQLEEWFEAAGLEQVEITQRNGNSWRGRGERPQAGGGSGP